MKKNAVGCLQRISVVALILFFASVGAVSADTLTWSTASSGDAQDGSGSWSTSGTNWVDSFGVYSAWNNSNGDVAVFGNGGAAGTVTAATDIVIGGLTFNGGVTGSYTIDGEPFILASPGQFITYLNVTATVNAPLTGGGTFNFNKLGRGTLELGGVNTYAGKTLVREGTLILNGGDNCLNTNYGIEIGDRATLDLNGGNQRINAGDFKMYNGSRLIGGTLFYRDASWGPNGFLVTFADRGAISSTNRLILNAGYNVMFDSDAGVSSFGGNANTAANYIGVDNDNSNFVVVKGGELNFTNITDGAGYLRIGCNGNSTTKPDGLLSLKGGVVRVGHSMNMGGRWNNYLSAAAYGMATLNIYGGTFKLGTGSSSSMTGGSHGFLYLGNNHADTVSSSTINLNGGTFDLGHLQAGAYGTNHFNFNGGILRAISDDATFINGGNLVCNLAAGGGVIDTGAYSVGINCDLTGVGGLTKHGDGTLTLEGANNFAGNLRVEGGTLQLDNLDFNNVPQLTGDLLSGIVLHLDATDQDTLFQDVGATLPVVGDGEQVAHWADLSACGKSAVQAVADRRPLYVASAAEFNGLPVLEFDGINDSVTSALDINSTNLPNMTLFIVYRQVTYKNDSGLWGHDNGSWDRFQLLNYQGQPGVNIIATDNSKESVLGLHTESVLVCAVTLRDTMHNGSHIYINGISNDSTGLPEFYSKDHGGENSITFGNIGSNKSSFFGNIRVGEVLIYSNALDNAQCSVVSAYLRDKWIGADGGNIFVAEDAVLELEDAEITARTLEGCGTISNGTVSVLETISPAGSSIGTLHVANVGLAGTLLIDAAPDGSCDLLNVSGDLALDNLSLQITESSAPDPTKSYEIINCGAILTGSFSAVDMDGYWKVCYNRTAGTASLKWILPGTVFFVR
jgi:autotransporter-associated beta strand protein